MEQKQNPNLSPEQKAVLFNKATERPFSGVYLNHHADGNYTCANCGAKLFESNRKFESHCGWPSFDEAIEGAVKYIDDNSYGMRRVEVVCANCGGHLGHIFPDGPRETTGQRFCINSLSLGFEEKKPKP
ncbi:MAG TPA: peptide-methionine (R)-S-oxide reductase MsrB [Anaerolineaceae bacterium]|nr:peptide-methionine (R)-S-oxide reductase MsrB [Anaerolineaceae bacterium]